MPLGPSGRKQEPLHVFWMALALTLSAALGGALGLIWQAAGFGGGGEPEEAATPAA